MYYVVAKYRGHYLASIYSDWVLADRLRELLAKDGIPCSFGQAEDIQSADPLLREALGPKEEYL